MLTYQIDNKMLSVCGNCPNWVYFWATLKRDHTIGKRRSSNWSSIDTDALDHFLKTWQDCGYPNRFELQLDTQLYTMQVFREVTAEVYIYAGSAEQALKRYNSGDYSCDMVETLDITDKDITTPKQAS